MGLTFTVGYPRDAFIEPFAEVVANTLDRHFSSAFAVSGEDEPYYSQEIGWSGWAELQGRAQKAMKASPPHHLLSMEAWQGVFVPVETDTGSFSFQDQKSPLKLASLPHLIKELEAFGRIADLLTDDPGLKALAARYLENDDIIDQDIDVQCYVQLLLAAHEAARRHVPLWVVK